MYLSHFILYRYPPPYFFAPAIPVSCAIFAYVPAVADLGGGMGGCIPPTSLKVTILAEKLASISNNSAPFRDASPPHQPQPEDSGRKTNLNVGEDLFFFLETT